MATLATLSIICGILSLLCLAVLHFVSAEYQPSWRMVSEYALGKHKWLITGFFVFWSLCTFFSACLLWGQVSSSWGMLGVVLVFITSVGALMGGLFDVKHKLHGMAFGLGVPFMPIGALITGYHLVSKPEWSDYKNNILLSSHAIWISLVLMAASMMLLFSGFKKAGLPMGPNIEPPQEMPAGVIGISGYMNRLLVLCYIAWSIVISQTYLKIH